MDFLFLNHSASVEAVIVFLCLSIIFLFLLYDAILWMKQKYRELYPRKAYVQENVVENKEEKTLDAYQFLERTKEIKVETPAESEVTKIETTEASPGEEPSLQNVTGDAPVTEIENNAPNIENTVEDSVVPDTLPLVELDGDTAVISSSQEESKDSTVQDEPKTEEPILSKDALVNDEKAPVLNIDHVVISEDKNTGETEKLEEKVSQKQEKAPGETKKESKKKSLSPEKKEKVIEIINNAKTLVARGHTDDARTLIVNGLSLEKNNRELNLLMAEIYERDHAFEKAEFVLKELAEHDPDDVEVLNHLATVVAMQRKFEVSYEIYKKILTLSGETEETLYTLAHIASELGLTEDIYNYSKSYLKQFPKNPEILWLYSQSQIAKSERKGAIETLIKLKNLTPYNQEIVDLISKLVTEDELAGNFGENPNI